MHTDRQIAIMAVAASKGDRAAAATLVTLLQASGHFCTLCGAMLAAGGFCSAHHEHGGLTRNRAYYRLSRVPFALVREADRELEIAENVFAAAGDRAGEVFARECRHVLEQSVSRVKKSSFKMPKHASDVVILGSTLP